MTVYNKVDINTAYADDFGFGGEFVYTASFTDYKYDMMNFFEMYTPNPYGNNNAVRKLAVKHFAFNYKDNPDPTPGTGASDEFGEATFSFPELVVDISPPDQTYPIYVVTDDTSFDYSSAIMNDKNEVIFSYVRKRTQNSWAAGGIDGPRRFASFKLRVIITKHNGYVDVPPEQVGGNIGIKTLSNWRVANILEFTIFETGSPTEDFYQQTGRYLDDIDSSYAEIFLLGNGNILVKTTTVWNEFFIEDIPPALRKDYPITSEKYIIFNKNLSIVNTFYEDLPDYRFSSINLTKNNFTRAITTYYLPESVGPLTSA